MRGLRASRRLSFGAALGAVVAVTATILVAASSAAGPTSHPISVDPQVSGPQKLQPNAVVFGCQSRPIDGSAGPRCYQPSQMQTAYGLTPLLGHGIDGHGKTIVIIDAFHDPFMADDLKIFDQVMGLPDPPHFKQFAPADSPPPFDPNDDNQVGWAIETALDVEWAHAMAPGANIVLAEARSNEDTDILNTTAAVVNHRLGDVVSQSFGENESCVDHSVLTQEEALFKKAVKHGMTLFASSGDSGAAQFNCDGTAAALAASSPASDPNVTGVGGTTLNADFPQGNYIGETAWTEPLFGCNPPAVDLNDINCSGGGFSVIYNRPGYQSKDVAGHFRGVPDVAYNAGVNGGVLFHCGVCNLLFAGADPLDPTIFFIVGGTSAGSPQWAGLAADADQLAGHDLGNINDRLYQIGHSKTASSKFHDITVGNNDVVEIGTGYDTAPGWDPVTGLGTPNAVNLLPALNKH